MHPPSRKGRLHGCLELRPRSPESLEIIVWIGMVGAAPFRAAFVMRYQPVDSPAVLLQLPGRPFHAGIPHAREFRRTRCMAQLDADDIRVAVAHLPAQAVLGHAIIAIARPIDRVVNRIGVVVVPIVAMVLRGGTRVRGLVDDDEARVQAPVPV